jgi:hypothetical protein
VQVSTEVVLFRHADEAVGSGLPPHRRPPADLDLLAEPSMRVSAHGAMRFDPAAYRKMAEQGTQVVKSFQLSDVEVLFPNDATAIVTYRVRQVVAPRGQGGLTAQEMNDSSTWVKAGSSWKCAVHTESPVATH